MPHFVSIELLEDDFWKGWVIIVALETWVGAAEFDGEFQDRANKWSRSHEKWPMPLRYRRFKYHLLLREKVHAFWHKSIMNYAVAIGTKIEKNDYIEKMCTLTIHPILAYFLYVIFQTQVENTFFPIEIAFSSHFSYMIKHCFAEHVLYSNLVWLMWVYSRIGFCKIICSVFHVDWWPLLLGNRQKQFHFGYYHSEAFSMLMRKATNDWPSLNKHSHSHFHLLSKPDLASI